MGKTINNKKKKIEELRETYENIISLFAEYKEGLTTREVYNAMCAQFGYSKSLKSIEHYLKDLGRGIVPGVKFTWIDKKKHQLEDHRSLTPAQFEKHLEKLQSAKILYGEEKAYMRLAMESIRELDTLSSKHHKEIEKRLSIDGLEESPYFIDNEDMESIDMSDADILDLKEAITKDAIVEFRYSGKSRKEHYIVEPYKLIIFDGLWYLFGKDRDDHKTPYKTWRLAYIEDVDYVRNGSVTHNMSDEHTEALLKSAEDADFVVDSSDKLPTIKKNITVKVKVYPEVLESFDHRAHIPGDVESPVKDKDGSLIVTTKVNTLNDVDAEIKAWFPHIEILEPKNYRQDFLLQICDYREKFKEEIERIKEKCN